MESDFIYVKDLRVIQNVSLRDMIIIDNSVLSFAFQLDNGIPILPYYDNKDDVELKFLTNYLNGIADYPDLRKENKKLIKLEYFLNKAKEEGDNTMAINSSNYESNEYKSNSSDVNGNLFSLNLCNNNYESENSVDLNLNNEEDKNKKHTVFQDLLFATLDDLKKSFVKK